MSQRASVRAIAKARLKAMGVPHVNKVMGLGLSHTRNQNMQRTSQGRKQLAAHLKLVHVRPPRSLPSVSSSHRRPPGWRARCHIIRKPALAHLGGGLAAALGRSW